MILNLKASNFPQQLAFYAVIVCWWLFLLTFWLRKRPPAVREAKRDWTSLIGLALQSVGFFLVWFDPLERRAMPSIASRSQTKQWFLAVVAIFIAICSVWLVNAAARRLGKQWALAARVVEGHELIQDGPYRFVRNPIYTGMFGMLLSTGLVVGRWNALAIAIVVFLAGTYIRIQSEERLLREAFGEKFDVYAGKVSAVIPGIY
jgi:protein-S-isoprenylcysteine O-methyltransferase Ste14